MSEWISVDDRLPDDNHDTLLVAVIFKHAELIEQFVDTDAFYTSDNFFRYWGAQKKHKVTHWMPLPELPACK